MLPPRPDALRLCTRASAARAPKPPFGLREWSPSATAIAVLLDRAGRAGRAVDPDRVACVAAQLPAPSTLPSGAPVFVLGVLATPRALWRLWVPAARAGRAERCSALLVRGYVDIGAGVDATTGADLAWGLAP